MITNEEVIENFIRTGKAIYKLALMEAKSEGIEEVPDSITVSGKSADGKLIKINIAITEIKRMKIEPINISKEEKTRIFEESLKNQTPYVEKDPVKIQPLSVIAEHIKQRLYETALNESDPAASDVIADIAERIDFWINELKNGEQNE